MKQRVLERNKESKEYVYGLDNTSRCNRTRDLCRHGTLSSSIRLQKYRGIPRSTLGTFISKKMSSREPISESKNLMPSISLFRLTTSAISCYTCFNDQCCTSILINRKQTGPKQAWIRKQTHTYFSSCFAQTPSLSNSFASSWFSPFPIPFLQPHRTQRVCTPLRSWKHKRHHRQHPISSSLHL